jgi:hypothetical protein
MDGICISCQVPSIADTTLGISEQYLYLSIGGWFKRMELIEVKSLIWVQKGKLYIIYENVMWIQWPTIPVWWQKKRYCSDMPNVVWGLQLIFCMHNSDLTPQGVGNRNILLWFKCILTALHVNNLTVWFCWHSFILVHHVHDLLLQYYFTQVYILFLF